MPCLQAVDVDVCNVTLAIVMELCRLGSFYKLIEQARKVASLPAAVRTGAKCPSNPEEAKAKVSQQLSTVILHAGSMKILEILH